MHSGMQPEKHESNSKLFCLQLGMLIVSVSC